MLLAVTGVYKYLWVQVDPVQLSTGMTLEFDGIRVGMCVVDLEVIGLMIRHMAFTDPVAWVKVGLAVTAHRSAIEFAPTLRLFA